MGELFVGTEQLRGMSDRLRATPDEPELLENVYLDAEGAWRTCGGYAQVTGAFAATDRVHSLHWFAQHSGGRQWLVLEHEVAGKLELSYVDYPTNALVKIETGRTLVHGPNPGTTYFESGDWLYVLNGYNAPMRWNGRRYEQAGFLQRPPGPTVSVSFYDMADGQTLNTPRDLGRPFQRGVGVEESSSDANASRYLYGYALQWINARGMASPRSAIHWISGRNEDASTAQLRGVGSINVILPKAPANVVAVRVLRTVNTYGGAATEGAAVYRVAEFSTGGRVAFADDAPDHELVLRYDDLAHGLWPTRARYAQLFKGSLFMDDGDSLRYSAPGFIEQIPETNRIYLGDSTSGPIMGFKSTLNALIVFKRRGIYLIKGDPVGGFFAETLTEDHGCAAPRAIVEVPGMGTLFLSDDGPYVMVGALENTGTPTLPQFVGLQLAKTWRTEVNWRALVSARATRHLRDREVWIQVPRDGDDRPGLGLIFHYEAGGWSKRTDYPFGCFAEARDHRGHLFAGSWSTSLTARRGVHVFTRGELLAEKDAVSSTITSPWLRADTAHSRAAGARRSLAYRVELYGINTGRNFDMTWHADRDAANWNGPGESQAEFVDREKKRHRWGSAVWGSSSFEPMVPVTMNLSVRENSSHEFQWRVVGGKLAVFGYHAVLRLPTDRKKRGIDV